MQPDDERREGYLYPVTEGEKTTCVALTEPDHGSHPHVVGSTAEKDGDGWVITGTKCWVTNRPYADFAAVFARTSGEPGDYGGTTCFPVDDDNPGFSVEKVHRTRG